MKQVRQRFLWHASRPPGCWDDSEKWGEWISLRGDAFAPCEDCTPEYRDRMVAAGRCARPETIFVAGSTGGVAGVCADDPRYARVLLGLAIIGGQPISATPAYTRRWRRLLERVSPRAHRDVRRAIQVWLKKGG